MNKNTENVTSPSKWSLLYKRGELQSREDGILGKCLFVDDSGYIHEVTSLTKREAEEKARKIVTSVNVCDEITELISEFVSEHDISVGGVDKAPSAEMIRKFKDILSRADLK